MQLKSKLKILGAENGQKWKGKKHNYVWRFQYSSPGNGKKIDGKSIKISLRSVKH